MKVEARPTTHPVIMGFRDHLNGVRRHGSTVSVMHDMMTASSASQHEPVIFDSITECPGHRAVMNILTRQRLCSVWNISPSGLLDALGAAMGAPSEPIFVDQREAECLQVDTEVDLWRLPIPWHHQSDGGRYMSASIIIAERRGQRNTSFHRQMIIDSDTMSVRLVPRHLRQFTDEARGEGEQLPIAIVNGPDPTVLLAAAMSFTERIDELTVASSLHELILGEPLRLVRLSNGIAVPADAEYVMTGRITLEDAPEGPYVDITGTVDEIRMQPVIEVDSIHHRQDPVFHALLPAGNEHKTLMGLPRAPTIKAAVNAVCDCHDVHLSQGGCGWLSAVVQITTIDSSSATDAIHAALAGHPSMKQVTIVNEDIPVDDHIKVEWAMMTRWQPDRDTVILTSQKGSSLDPSAVDGLTSKVGFDATIPHGIDDAPFRAVF